MGVSSVLLKSVVVILIVETCRVIGEELEFMKSRSEVAKKSSVQTTKRESDTEREQREAFKRKIMRREDIGR
jgi:hypothetical protein